MVLKAEYNNAMIYLDQEQQDTLDKQDALRAAHMKKQGRADRATEAPAHRAHGPKDYLFQGPMEYRWYRPSPVYANGYGTSMAQDYVADSTSGQTAPQDTNNSNLLTEPRVAGGDGVC